LISTVHAFVENFLTHHLKFFLNALHGIFKDFINLILLFRREDGLAKPLSENKIFDKPIKN
jgi:hypothetical protein